MTDQTYTFTEIVQQLYGEPRDVLRLIESPVTNIPVRATDVLIRVVKRPIHPGDVHIIRGSIKGGTPSPIEQDKPRVPGYEGVGVVERLGSDVERNKRFSVGQRVVFFDGNARSWASKTSVPVRSVVALPDAITDAVAAQMLINTVTALVVLRKLQAALPHNAEMPASILQSASGSAVGRLITRIAVDRGFEPIRLVRSHLGAASLDQTASEGPIIVTDDLDWIQQVRKAKGDKPLLLAVDSVGGALLSDLASLIDFGGSIVGFGTLGSGESDLSGFAPRGLSFLGAAMPTWLSASVCDREADIAFALSLAMNEPKLFPVSAEYPLEKFQEAIEHVSRPGKNGTVMLTS